MLEREDMKAIGRLLRTEYEALPKGAIPDRIWQLLLKLEQAAQGDGRDA